MGNETYQCCGNIVHNKANKDIQDIKPYYTISTIYRVQALNILLSCSTKRPIRLYPLTIDIKFISPSVIWGLALFLNCTPNDDL